MAERLTEFFGNRTPGGYRCFPSPARIFQEDRPTLTSKSKMGYRAELLSKISRAVVEGTLDLSEWEQLDASTKEIRSKILELKGFGPYAAASILALVNRYDFLPVDSIFMAHVSRLYFNDEHPTHNQAEGIYDQWDRWKYLAYWFER
jgi:3-methyladenine DNA glycosylase/8-oxoguanine DNA glycosylase